METIQEKYERLRPQIGNGCLGVMSKNALISKVILKHDRNPDRSKAEFSHVFSIFESDLNGEKRLFVLDANPGGVKPAFLSDRIRDCNNFLIIKPLCSQDVIEKALSTSFDRAQTGIKYDYKNAIKEGLNRRYGFSLNIKKEANKDICSEWTETQAITQDMVTEPFKSLKLTFPQDYIRYNKESTTLILK